MAKTEKVEKGNKRQKHFWKDFKAELKKVIWPTRSQVVNNTIIVIAIVLVVTAIVFVLDLAFESLNTYGIDKVKTLVQNQTVVSDENENTNSEESNGDNVGEENTDVGDTANVDNNAQ